MSKLTAEMLRELESIAHMLETAETRGMRRAAECGNANGTKGYSPFMAGWLAGESAHGGLRLRELLAKINALASGKET